MQHKRTLIIFIALLMTLPFLLFAWPVFAADSQPQETETVNIYFFWGDGCPHCETAKPVLEEIADQNPRVNLHEFEVYKNEANLDLFFEFGAAYGIEPRGVPTIFIADKVWVGYSANIQLEINQTIETCLASSCTDLGRDVYSPESDPAMDTPTPTQEIIIVTATPQEEQPAEETRSTGSFFDTLTLSNLLIIIGIALGFIIFLVIVVIVVIKLIKSRPH